MKKQSRPWNIKSTGEDSGEITLYGDIVSDIPTDLWGKTADGDYITPDGFRDDLAAVKDKKNITVKINSCGGDLYTGIAIHNALKSLNGHKTVVVEGIAASAASVIAMAGDEIEMFPGSLMMIHGVSGYLDDYYTIQDLKKIMKSLDASERAVAAVYSERTGMETDKIRGMMERETWMTGDEAVELGFADKVNEDADGVKIAASADRSMLLVSGVHIDARGINLPKEIPTNKRIHPVDSAGENTKSPADSGEKLEARKMTLDELKNEAPEVVAEIEKAAADKQAEEMQAKAKEAVQNAAKNAVDAERARLKKIDDMASHFDLKNSEIADMVMHAKYDEPCEAGELALKLIETQENFGHKVVDDMVKDAANANKVAAAPAPKAEEPVDKIAQSWSAAAEAYNKRHNGGK